jgi:hypothetical protein
MRATAARPESPDPRFAVQELLAEDNFSEGLARWRVESEPGGTVAAHDGVLEIDVPEGCTVWFKDVLSGPVLIVYEVAAVNAGGANDRVSDLNCFWMARDSRNPADLFATSRSGKFADYDWLRGYYVGLGGNGNTTTRFRRYVGERGNRPLLPEHDLSDRKVLIAPNVRQVIQLLAADGTVEFFRDALRIFEYRDGAPYTSGWFGFRTVASHLRISHFRVYRLTAIEAERSP